MKKYLWVLSGFVFWGGLLGCTQVTDFDKSKIETTERVSFVLQYNQEIQVEGFDVLFVLDTTDDTAAVADRLMDTATNLEAMLMRPDLEGGNEDGIVYPLHVGIITPDMGAMGLTDVPFCSQKGDEALLLNHTGEDCPPLSDTDPFLVIRENKAVDYEDPNTGSPMEMGKALDCLFRGQMERTDVRCSFDQPLKAVVEAIKKEENRDFFRPSAGLAIIFVSNEDDCSASRSDLYDQGSTELGALDSFRCFRHGVVCDEDTATVGVKHNCKPNPSGDLLLSIDKIYQDLVEVKDPETILVANVVAPLSSVVVDTDANDDPKLQKSCTTSSGGGSPAIRLEALRNRFPRGDLQSSICDPALGELLYKISDRMSAQTAVRCIPQEPADGDPSTPDMEADCYVWEVKNLDQVNEEREGPYPACDPEEIVYPCFNVTQESICSSGYKLDIMRDQPPQLGTEVLAECMVRIEEE